MARVKVLAEHEYPAELRERLPGEEPHATSGVWATRPDLMVPYRAFWRAIGAAASIDKRLVELVRLRIAFHNQCRSCMARRSHAAMSEGLTEDLVCQIEAPEQAPDLTERERAALHYADLLATDHMSITDSTFERLRRHFSNDEIVELGLHCALFLGFGRVAMSWDLVDDLPDRFRQRGVPVTPWEPAAAGQR